MTTETSEYPAWQEELRAAQAEIRAEIEAEQTAMLEAQAALDLRIGVLLEGALELFGIELSETPMTNKVELDGIRFLISRYVKNVTGAALIKEALHAHEPNERYEFDLEVCAVLEGKYVKAQEDYEDYSTYKSLAIRHDLDNPDYSQEKAQLADAIDEVLLKAKSFMAKVDAWEAAEANPPAPLPTLSQQLESLLREIVRDELMKQSYGDYEI